MNRITHRTIGAWQQLRRRYDRLIYGDPEAGSVTIEKVVWAVAVIAIAAIVITAITIFVTNEAAKIK